MHTHVSTDEIAVNQLADDLLGSDPPRHGLTCFASRCIREKNEEGVQLIIVQVS